MDSLSVEIWHRVFLKLDLKERITCTLVCRKWWDMLDKYSLFNNVELLEGRNAFVKFMEMMARYPHRGAQVEVLRIRHSFDSSC
jgi:hypothetical protein